MKATFQKTLHFLISIDVVSDGPLLGAAYEAFQAPLQEAANQMLLDTDITMASGEATYLDMEARVSPFSLRPWDEGHTISTGGGTRNAMPAEPAAEPSQPSVGPSYVSER